MYCYLMPVVAERMGWNGGVTRALGVVIVIDGSVHGNLMRVITRFCCPDSHVLEMLHGSLSVISIVAKETIPRGR